MDTPKPVSMTAIAHHSYNAIPHAPGDTYDADPFYVDTLIALNFAKRTAPAPPAPAARHAYQTTEARAPEKAVLTDKPKK